MTNNFFDNISTINNKIDNNNKKDKNNLQDLSFERSFELTIISKSERKDKFIIEKNKIIDNDYFNEPELNDNQNLIKLNLSNIKIRKEDLDNIPLPIFSCIYCANELISFSHLSNEIISDKYLFLTSIYDLEQLNFLISFKIPTKKNEYNDKLLNIYLDNFEYIFKYNNYRNSKKFFNDNIFKGKCLKSKSDIYDNLKNHFNLFFKKIMKKESKSKPAYISKKYKYIFENSGNNTDRGKLKNAYKLIKNININKRVNEINSSLLNSYSYYKSFNRRFYYLDKSKSNNMVRNKTKIIIESKDKKKDFIDILEEDNLKRKINKNDIEWENDYYDVYNPEIEDDFLDIEDVIKEKKLKINKNLIKMYLGDKRQYNDNITFNYLNHLEKGSISAKNRIHINLKSNNKNISVAFLNSNIKKNLINRIKNPLLYLNNSNFHYSKFNLNIETTENKIIPKIYLNNHNKNDNSINKNKKKKKLKDLYQKTEKEFEIVKNKALNFKRIITEYSQKDKKQIINNNLYYQNNKINLINNINNMSNNIFCINTEEKKKYNILNNKKNCLYNKENLFNKNITSSRIKSNKNGIIYNKKSFLLKSKNFEVSKKMHD